MSLPGDECDCGWLGGSVVNLDPSGILFHHCIVILTLRFDLEGGALIHMGGFHETRCHIPVLWLMGYEHLLL